MLSGTRPPSPSLSVPCRWPARTEYSRILGTGSEESPQGLARMTARQMERERSRLLAEPAANLNEAQPQGIELHARDADLDR